METSKSLVGDNAGQAQPFLDSSESLCVGDGVCMRVGAEWVHSLPVVPSTGMGNSCDMLGLTFSAVVPATAGAWGGLGGLFPPPPTPL